MMILQRITCIFILTSYILVSNGFRIDQNEEKKKREVIKTLMKLIGLTEADLNTKERPKIPLPLWKLYLKWKDEDYESMDKINSDAVSFIHHEEDKLRPFDRSKHLLHFDLSKIEKPNSLYKVQLLLHSTNDLSKTKRLTVTDDQNKTIAVKRVANLRNSETSIDVTQQVREQLEKNNNALTLGISRLPNLHIRRSRDISDKHWHDKRPILLVYNLGKQQKPRVKRNAIHARYYTNHCHLQKYELDLRRHNMHNNIMRPTVIELNTCNGICELPLGRDLNPTNHAVIQSTVHSIKKIVPPVCCVPSHLKSVVFFILKKSRLTFVRFEDITATACGCR